MISRVRMRKSGLADYLKSGHREDSKYNREDKDNVVVLYGNLEHLKQAEIYTNKHKKWNYNYEHITISFSKEDMKRLDTLNDSDRLEALNDMALQMIKHRTSGYDLDSEVIAYAEVHQPKIKQEFGKERLEHIHIGISYLNPLNDTKLRTTFYNNSYISDTIDKYIALKHNLTYANTTSRINDIQKTDIGRYRKQLKEDLKDINSREELLQYFKDNDIKYREVKTKNNHYFKVINKSMNDINLRGKGFEHISNIVSGKHLEDLKNKKLEDLEKILSTYYKNRIEDIDKRRSVATKEAIKNIYKEDTKEDEYSISTSYQQKIFYKHYKYLIKSDLKGYYIDTKDNNNTKFINKSKNINIEDKGNKIVSYANDKKNLQERVRLMLNIAEAKKWNINNLEINGSDKFKQEAEKQIAQRIRLQEQLQKKNDKTLSHTEAVAVKQEIEKRPTTATQQYKRLEVEKQQQTKADNDISLSMLKQNLQAQRVLDYAVEKYKLNANDYEVTEDNKINNLNNRQKPKNVIDFLQKELNIKTSEAIDITRELYKQQPLNINKEEQREVNTMPMKLSICKDTNVNSLNKWEQVEVNSYSELASYMKQYPYSATQFENRYRNSDNAKSFNNVLIYDIDNDPKELKKNRVKAMSINEAKELLEKHNISAMILPSKSHNIDKNGVVAERYRIVIPLKKAISINDKDTYREFQKITARALKIYKYVDKKALNDKARFYYKSPISAEPMVIKSNRVMNIENLQNKAKENIQEQQRQRELEQQRASEIRANIQQYRTVQREANNNLTYANVDKIMQLNIKQLINHFEKDTQEYKDGSYEMIKTANAKYSILDNNVAHDFKSDTTHNSLTYLQHKLGTSNINNVARELEKLTGEKYMEVNYPRVKEAAAAAMFLSTNDRSFEENIKSYFNVKKCQIDFKKETLIIADRELKFSEIDITKEKLIKKFQENRKMVNANQKVKNQGLKL